MGEMKTRPTDADVDAFLAAIPDPARRADCEALRALMAEATGQVPVLWGTSIVGFGEFVYADRMARRTPGSRSGSPAARAT